MWNLNNYACVYGFSSHFPNSDMSPPSSLMANTIMGASLAVLLIKKEGLIMHRQWIILTHLIDVAFNRYHILAQHGVWKWFIWTADEALNFILWSLNRQMTLWNHRIMGIILIRLKFALRCLTGFNLWISKTIMIHNAQRPPPLTYLWIKIHKEWFDFSGLF